jgi:hypothetical protein
MSPLKLKTEAERREEEKRGKEFADRLLAAYARFQRDQMDREAYIRAKAQQLAAVSPGQQLPPPEQKKRRSVLFDRVVAKMRETDRAELEMFSEKEMVERYGAKRDLNRRARTKVLAE